MKCNLRLTNGLWDEMHGDMNRPHAVASERVGFLAARSAGLEGGDVLLIGYRYAPVGDSHYIPDLTVGARIDSDAIRAAMQMALGEDASVLYVHRHEHPGTPRFSRTDLKSIPEIARACTNVRPHRPHGALVLSRNSASAIIWVPQCENPMPISRIIVVGMPSMTFGVST